MKISKNKFAIAVLFLLISLGGTYGASAQSAPGYPTTQDYSNNYNGGQGQPLAPSGGQGQPYTGGSSGGSMSSLQNPLNKKFTSVGAVVEGFIEILSYLAILIAVFMIIWTGLQYILAQGNTEKLKESTKRLTYILIGVAVVLGARLLITVIINTLEATGTVNQQVITGAKSAVSGQ